MRPLLSSGLLVKPVLVFKVRVDPVAFMLCRVYVTCPKIHLWCDTSRSNQYNFEH